MSILAQLWYLFYICTSGAATAGDDLPDEIIIIGDIHGDAAGFKRILMSAGVIDSELNWIESDEKKAIVQLGDVADRGENTLLSYTMLSILMDNKPPQHDLVMLLGNHELMLMCGDYRYFNPKEMQLLFKGSKDSLSATVGPEGEVGQFIRREFKLKHIIGDTVFVHAGIEMPYANTPNEDLLADFWKDVDQGKCIPSAPFSAIAPNGPVWTRNVSGVLRDDPDDDGTCAYVKSISEISDINKFVVGHTPTEGIITNHCDNRWVLHDTGISVSMANRPSFSKMYKTRDTAGNVVPTSQWNHEAFMLRSKHKYTLHEYIEQDVQQNVQDEL